MRASNASLIFLMVISFTVENTNSINETLGVGTLKAIPSNFPF